MNDNYIILMLIKNGKINSHYKLIICKDIKILTYLENRYKDSNSIIETIYRIWKCIEEKPKCKYCGKPLKFISGIGYKDFCSVGCSKKYVDNISRDDITDDVIKNDYLINGNINTNKLLEKYIREHGYYDYLINRYSDSYSLTESVYRICNDIEEKPKCVVCGKPVKLKSLLDGFAMICSDICDRKNSVTDIDDDYIKSLSLKGQAFRKDWRGYNKVYEYLENKFGDLFRSYDEAVYMVRQNISEIPKCPVCGKFVQYRKNRNKGIIHYTKYCSNECYNLDVRLQTVDKLVKEIGINILIDNDKYKFINACNIHKTFYMDIDMFHNRCKLDRLAHDNVLCPICNPERSSETNIELKIKYLLDNKNLNYVLHTRDLIEGKELDFYLPKYKLAIECNGMYWHSIHKKDKNYHKEKYEACKAKGIKLLLFWEYDIIYSLNVISNIIDMFTLDPCLYENILVKLISNEIYESYKKVYWFNREERTNIKIGIYDEDNLVCIVSARETHKDIHVTNIIPCKQIDVSKIILHIVTYLLKYGKLIKLYMKHDLAQESINIVLSTTKKYIREAFYFDQSKNMILSKVYNKKLYGNDIKFLCYTSGITEYTIYVNK